jgi:hypothetical protein
VGTNTENIGTDILKGLCHEIFDSWSFHQKITPRSLIQGLTPFCIWLRIRREIRDNRVKSLDSAPAMSMLLRDHIPRCQLHRGIPYDTANNSRKRYLSLMGNHSKKKYISKHHIHIVTRKRKY